MLETPRQPKTAAADVGINNRVRADRARTGPDGTARVKDTSPLGESRPRASDGPGPRVAAREARRAGRARPATHGVSERRSGSRGAALRSPNPATRTESTGS